MELRWLKDMPHIGGSICCLLRTISNSSLGRLRNSPPLWLIIRVCLLILGLGCSMSFILWNTSYMGVSINQGTPKTTVYHGNFDLNRWFGGSPISGNLHMIEVHIEMSTIEYQTGHVANLPARAARRHFVELRWGRNIRATTSPRWLELELGLKTCWMKFSEKSIVVHSRPIYSHTI
jgi:hypothetical protein